MTTLKKNELCEMSRDQNFNRLVGVACLGILFLFCLGIATITFYYLFFAASCPTMPGETPKLISVGCWLIHYYHIVLFKLRDLKSVLRPTTIFNGLMLLSFIVYFYMEYIAE